MRELAADGAAFGMHGVRQRLQRPEHAFVHVQLVVEGARVGRDAAVRHRRQCRCAGGHVAVEARQLDAGATSGRG